MGITPSMIAAGASLFGTGMSLFGGGGNSPPPQQPLPPPPQLPPGYQFGSLPGADTGAFGGTQGLTNWNTAGAAVPYAQNTFQQLYNNPYAGQYQQNANSAAQTGWGVGGAQTGAGLDLMQAGQGMLPYAQSILNTGFDPNGALRDRTEHQLTESTRAGLSQRGLNMSPYGAGVENKALSDFNIDWQNNLLNRQNTAAQGAGYLTNSGGNAINLGQNVSTLGLQTLGNAAALPYSTANTIGGNQNQAIGQFGQAGQAASALPQQQILDYLAYLQHGNQAYGTQVGALNQQYATQVGGINQQNANAITSQNNQFNQGQTLGKNFGAGIQGLFPNGFSFGGSRPAVANGYDPNGGF